MKVEHLTLRQYRNYQEVSVDLNPDLNILVGQNAQGKTNFIEGLYFLALGRSHRTYQDSELIHWGNDWASLSALVASELGKYTLEARIQSGRRKQFRVSGNALRSLSELYGYLNVVMFSPDDLQLVKGSPVLRRNFLDVVLAQSSAVYRNYLVEYNRILQQRNAVLKLVSEHRTAISQLDAWDPQLVRTGSRIIAARHQAVKSLGKAASQLHAAMTGYGESLAMIYRPFYETKESEQDDDIPELSEIEARFEEALLQRREDENRRGMTLVGPQRDDLVFLIDGVDARSFGSQGQQRTVVLSCKLAEAEFIKSETGEYPVLLLDDVMSELDQSRRLFFLEAIKKKVQILLTTTSLHSFSPELMSSATLFQVEQGNLTVL